MRARTLMALAAASTLALTSVPAAADSKQERQARTHYQKGKAFYDIARFKEAAEEFEKAHSVLPDPFLIVNAARCYQHLGDKKRALFLYKSAIREAKDPKYRKDPQYQQMQASLTVKVTQLEELIAAQEAGKVISAAEEAAVGPDAPLPLGVAGVGEPAVAATPPAAAPVQPSAPASSPVPSEAVPAPLASAPAPAPQNPPATPSGAPASPSAPAAADSPPIARLDAPAPPPYAPLPPSYYPQASGASAPTAALTASAPAAFQADGDRGGTSAWIWVLLGGALVGGAVAYYLLAVREPGVPDTTLGHRDLPSF